MSRARSLLVTLLLATVPCPGSATDLLIRDVRVVDLSGSSPSEPVSILVRDGRIAEIGHEVPASGARSIDARGGFLLPGLFDAHAHLGWGPSDGLREPSRPELWGKLREHHMRAYLACGVTTLLDPSAPGHVVRDVHALLSGGSPGPRYLTLGPLLMEQKGNAQPRKGR